MSPESLSQEKVGQMDLAGRALILKTGKIAKQAGGSVWVQYGDTVLFVAATGASKGREGIDFFPLTVDYREKTYAAGKIPGGFFKREARPKDSETLTARIIDRPIRPLFPKDFLNEVQVQALLISDDKENDGKVLAITAASVALNISDIPFGSFVSAVTVAKIEGKLVINPVRSSLANADLEVMVAGTSDSIMMVEGEANQIPDDEMVEALDFAHQEIKKICAFQEEFVQDIRKPKRSYTPAFALQTEIEPKVREIAEKAMEAANKVEGKLERQEAVENVLQETLDKWHDQNPDQGGSADGAISSILESIEAGLIRRAIVHDGQRVDGRSLAEVRDLAIEVGVIPRAHGSSLFTRGQTQALVSATLGPPGEAMIMDELDGRWEKKFWLHYNFPSYSVGEVRPNRGPGRREIGHGMLAERALKPVVPIDSWPYVIRVVSEIMESNGSSSMASVCGGSLALMDAGVPITDQVAGIAMGLIEEDGKTAILTDIAGAEDHFGDMDFKVAGTRKGITAIQMDIKISGVSKELLSEALSQAQTARNTILDAMDKVLAKPRENLSPWAPRIVELHVNPEKIGAIIGPGGRVIRKLSMDYGVSINVDDDGKVSVAGDDAQKVEKALEDISLITEEVKPGKVYKGTVKKIMDFGAFVEVLPGQDGLLHISQIDHKRIERVADVLKEGDVFDVKVIGVDEGGKIRLSRKELLPPPPGGAAASSSSSGSPGGSGQGSFRPKSGPPRRPSN